ncbi:PHOSPHORIBOSYLAMINE--GLYCINE LIGASE [Salix viminalis]|uniref:Glycinamide ribonucleotide synthetase n=1 Tax=Salix viminalis TaxID=40686 RepID=A0A9Q0TPU5_SALVM|nr:PHOSPHORIBOSYLAMINE--GLYCINE LIGASE [Salix viminalis]
MVEHTINWPSDFSCHDYRAKVAGSVKLRHKTNGGFFCIDVQVLMVRMESDLAQVLLAASRGELSGVSLKWSLGAAMVVVMASKGYLGTEIRNLEEAENVAGTTLNSDGNFIATGGRVLGVTATGRDLEEARDRAYQAVEEIN